MWIRVTQILLTGLFKRFPFLTSHERSYNEAEIPSLNYKATVWSLACITFRPEALDVHAYSEQRFLREIGAG